jgi:hypothetical protein
MSALDRQQRQDELDRFRDMLNDYWEIVYERADYRKEPNLADVKMNELYRSFGPNARRLCSIVLSEWLGSTDGNLRFAAFSLIRTFRITSAIPALKTFIQNHGNPETAPERFDLRKAEQVLEHCMAATLADTEDQGLTGD